MKCAGLAILVSLLALLSACGTVESPDPKPNLFDEYIQSGDVKNDRFPGGGSGEDRVANFASRYSADEFYALLLSAFPCEDDAEVATDCRLTDTVRDAAATPNLYGRTIVVKRQDGSLELLMLWVTSGTLIDSTGETYRGGLDDFLENNDLLSSDDIILAPREMTSVAGESKVVTVYGHTVVNWTPWVIGGLGALVLLGGGLVVVRRVTARRRDEELMEEPPPAS